MFDGTKVNKNRGLLFLSTCLLNQMTSLTEGFCLERLTIQRVQYRVWSQELGQCKSSRLGSQFSEDPLLPITFAMVHVSVSRSSRHQVSVKLSERKDTKLNKLYTVDGIQRARPGDIFVHIDLPLAKTSGQSRKALMMILKSLEKNSKYKRIKKRYAPHQEPLRGKAGWPTLKKTSQKEVTCSLQRCLPMFGLPFESGSSLGCKIFG